MLSSISTEKNSCGAGRFRLWSSFASAPDLADDQKDTWKILRAPSTNSCIAVVITAVDPSRPELLGKYKTKADAIAALEDFKKQDDPKKANFKMCE